MLSKLYAKSDALCLFYCKQVLHLTRNQQQNNSSRHLSTLNSNHIYGGLIKNSKLMDSILKVTFATQASKPKLTDLEPGSDQVLTNDCLDFLRKLHNHFEDRRQALLKERVKKQISIDNGYQPVFLPETKNIRESNWEISALPTALERRHVEITGPVDKKMVINALNSGSNCFMADFEDSNTPTWRNQISGQINLMNAIRRKIDFKASDTGKEYKLNEKIATLLVRPRGWHLDEKHIIIGDKRLSGSLFDFGMYFFHNAKELISQGLGPYFYLPKLENHLEARLWNDVFLFSQEELGIPRGTIKATVLIENILAAFEMDEILYELREHSAGLNAGRWDYIFSCIKKFKSRNELCFADRSLVTMAVPFMRAYATLLVKTCHKRNAPAMGGMSALIPIRADASANEKAMNGVREDKAREASIGFDGTWVAHPGLVDIARQEFVKVLGDKDNQREKKLNDVTISGVDLLNFSPNKPITENGLRHNISVGIQYLSAWLAGTGCVPINNLMEDAATAEISRSQVWQWIRSEQGVLEDGRKVSASLVTAIIEEEVAKVIAANPKSSYPYNKAAEIFSKMSTNEEFADFLTLPLYENL